jgi:hypothetical protein
MLRSYSPKAVSIAIAGIPITGFSPDSIIALSRNTDIVEEEVGAQGDLSLTQNADRTGEITISLMQTSPSNALLSLGAQSQENVYDNVLPFSITVLDPSGSVLAYASNCYYKSFPDVEVGASQSAREWMFGCETLTYGSVVF